jgi:putative DNA primase/helicase
MQLHTKEQIERSADCPPMMGVDFDNIPDALKTSDNWVHWYYYRNPLDKWTKVPLAWGIRAANDKDGSRRARERMRLHRARSNSPATWASFESVSCALMTHEELAGRLSADLWLGVGFVLTEGQGLVGIDLDNCRNRATGEITEKAAAIVRVMNSYTEVSPSGTGLRIYVLGVKPGPRCKNKEHGIEVYSNYHFMAVTGQRLEGCPAEVMSRQAELDQFYAALFPADERDVRSDGTREEYVTSRPSGQRPVLTDDAELIDRAMSAANGDRFAQLWHGDTSGQNGDRSAADFALASHLAFWCGPDAARIESLMRQSGLARSKWQKRPKYLAQTVRRAVARARSFFGDGRHGDDAEMERISRLTFTIVRPRQKGPRQKGPCLTGQGASGDGASVMGEFDDLGSESARQAAEEARQERRETAKLRAAVRCDDRPRCPRCDRTILQRIKDGCTVIQHTRCNAWKCHTSCALELKARWRNNFKFRLTAPDLGPVFTATVSGREWRTVLKRLHRGHADYFRFSPNCGETYFLVATAAPTADAIKQDGASAEAQLAAMVGRYVGDVSPITSSAGWRLSARKRRHGPPVYTRVGKVHESLTDEEVEEFAERNGCRVGWEMLGDGDPRIQRRVEIDTPPGWSSDRLGWFNNGLKTGIVDVPYFDPGFFDDVKLGKRSDGPNCGSELDLTALSP